MRPGVQTPERPRPEESPEPFFWRLLSDAGKRSVVVDAFMNCPLEDFHGTQVLEYGTWTWFSQPGTRPPTLQREILDRFGRYPAEDHSKVLGPPELDVGILELGLGLRHGGALGIEVGLEGLALQAVEEIALLHLGALLEQALLEEGGDAGDQVHTFGCLDAPGELGALGDRPRLDRDDADGGRARRADLGDSAGATQQKAQ